VTLSEDDYYRLLKHSGRVYSTQARFVLIACHAVQSGPPSRGSEKNFKIVKQKRRGALASRPSWYVPSGGESILGMYERLRVHLTAPVGSISLIIVLGEVTDIVDIRLRFVIGMITANKLFLIVDCPEPPSVERHILLWRPSVAKCPYTRWCDTDG